MTVIDLAELVTVPNVPVVETGIDYPASTGDVTFTAEDLRSIVESQGDPAIVAPRIKLGHLDPRFNTALLDGEPAFGTVQNLRLTNAGNTVVGDLTGTPEWLATILPSAFPNRSIEGNWDVQTTTGHKWQFVMTDLALLGVVWPGVQTLDDLQAAYSKDGPEGVTVTVTASTNMEDVRRTFYDEFTTQESGRYWWWVRAVLLDPDELIVDDDEGGLYRVPFSVSGDDIEFSDPIPVKIEYVDTPVAASALANSAKKILAAYANSRDSRPANRRQEEKVTVRNVTASVDLANLRRVLGLPEDATEEQVNQVLAQRAEESGDPTPPVEPPAAPASPPQEPAQPPASPPASEPEPQEQPQPAGAAASSSGFVTVDQTVLAELQRKAERGDKAFERQQVSDRDSYLAAAVNAGKFPPARVQHWAQAWDRDPDGIKAAIDQMPEGLIPVGQRGGAPAETATDQPIYPPGWLPARAGGTVTQEA